MLIVGAAVVLIIVGIIFYVGRKPSIGPGARLVFWDAVDSNIVWKPMIEEFNKTFSNIQISYVKKDPKTFEDEFIKALARGEGPDIFSFYNTWLPKYVDLVRPLSLDFQNQWGFEPRQFSSIYPKVVSDDFLSSQGIYALPLYVDTLALYYNRDFFDSRGIPNPPTTWDEFVKTAQTFTKKDERGNIIRSGAALGKANNIDKATDILSILMIQKGNNIIDRSTKSVLIGKDEKAKEALNFYVSFANPQSLNYSWDLPGVNSIDAFSQGKSVMMINYAEARSLIRSKSPTLNFLISTLPQFDPDLRKDYADYYGLSVTRRSRAPDQAWNFITFAASQAGANAYLSLSGRPPARRDFLSLKFDEELAVFARQVLSAKSWYQPDQAKIVKIFTDMIESVVGRRSTADKAIDLAAQELEEITASR